MFTKHGEREPVSQSEGIERTTLVWGEHTLLGEFRLAAGADLPEHSHPHEQTGYVVKGRMRFILRGEEPIEVGPGDAWCIAGDVPHKAEIIEDAVVIEVFSPRRDEFLPE